MADRVLRYGMVGGDLHAFIGGVHRIGIAFSGCAELTAGSFSSHGEKNRDTGRFYHLDEERVYANYREMAEKESEREDGIDFVAIVTPNNTHYEIAKEFLLHGIHVVCEKPLCGSVAQAEELRRLAKEKGLLFAVNYAYTGNAMVKLARQLVREGVLGRIIDVSAEYLQEWLIDMIGDETAPSGTAKLSGWRSDPAVSGNSNCVGDIGTHVENTVSYITGLQVKKVAARLDRFGQPLDLNANILVQFDNGASGSFLCSQVAAGHMNGLGVRVFGTNGALEWWEEDCNMLRVTRKGEPPQIYSKGAGYLHGRPAEVTRAPAGHPEGYYESFANFYEAFLHTLLKKLTGEALKPGEDDFPTVDSGVAGVRFVQAVLESDRQGSAWVDV